MNVSFIIASNRPLSFVERTIVSINALPQGRFKYEILVYSPLQYPIKSPNTTFFFEEEQKGPHVGFNILANAARGDYIYQLVDDMAIHPDGWNAIDLLESNIFANRRYKVTTLATMHEPVRCGWPHPDGFMIPNHLCMRFPVMRRDMVKEFLGGYFYHPELYYHQADAWLGYWLGEMGEPGIEAVNANATLHTRIAPPTHHDCKDTEIYFDLIRSFRQGNKKYVRL